MTTFASIEEAWGHNPNFYDITQRPASGPAPANAPAFKESFASSDDETRAFSDPRRSFDMRRIAKEYLRRVYASEGVEGLCRLLDRRARREIRNASLFDLGRDDLLIVFLVAVVAYLSFKLAMAKK
jgi:hypothetical protein